MLVMVGGPLPEPHITKQCCVVACQAAQFSPPVIAPGGNPGLILPYKMRGHTTYLAPPHTSPHSSLLSPGNSA